ncbi:hypothetical protein AVEN_218079-1 [Araneus ventricosus]|uniref:Uncharacterized protein n=1 Tax=Araneus ventricosus TaxID=182803 RepID=A0A4Y2HPH4_ARAVE|nr:hypothetical protein AVEN_218079-1 [Araneus ventricosus]
MQPFCRVPVPIHPIVLMRSQLSVTEGSTDPMKPFTQVLFSDSSSFGWNRPVNRDKVNRPNETLYSGSCFRLHPIVLDGMTRVGNRGLIQQANEYPYGFPVPVHPIVFWMESHSM